MSRFRSQRLVCKSSDEVMLFHSLLTLQVFTSGWEGSGGAEARL